MKKQKQTSQKSSYGFVDINIVDWKDCPPWVRDGKTFLEKNIGLPCKKYAPGCISCKAWREFLDLAILFEDYSK